jgi:hypothetical protein
METMSGRSSLSATNEQKAALAELARSELRGEADRARAILLMPCSSTSVALAEPSPATLPGGGEEFVEMVLPELRRRGLFRSEYEGKTLQENLGLRPTVNRHPG